MIHSSEHMWWKAQAVIYTSISILLALIWSIQLIRTIQAETEGQEFQGSVNPLKYEEGRETMYVVICIAWMKMTSHVSRHHFRSAGHVLPAPRRLVMTSLYLTIVPLMLTLVCILRCQSQGSNACLAVIGF